MLSNTKIKNWGKICKKLIHWMFLGYWIGEPLCFIYLYISELKKCFFSIYFLGYFVILNTAISACETTIPNRS